MGTTIVDSKITPARINTTTLGLLYFLIIAPTIARNIAIPIADQKPIHSAYATGRLPNK